MGELRPEEDVSLSCQPSSSSEPKHWLEFGWFSIFGGESETVLLLVLEDMSSFPRNRIAGLGLDWLSMLCCCVVGDRVQKKKGGGA